MPATTRAGTNPGTHNPQTAERCGVPSDMASATKVIGPRAGIALPSARLPQVARRLARTSSRVSRRDDRTDVPLGSTDPIGHGSTARIRHGADHGGSNRCAPLKPTATGRCASSSVDDYCRYGAVSMAQLQGCLDHVTAKQIDRLSTNAARYSRGKLGECLSDFGTVLQEKRPTAPAALARFLLDLLEATGARPRRFVLPDSVSVDEVREIAWLNPPVRAELPSSVGVGLNDRADLAHGQGWKGVGLCHGGQPTSAREAQRGGPE